VAAQCLAHLKAEPADLALVRLLLLAPLPIFNGFCDADAELKPVAAAEVACPVPA
jgi:hypothetical protein